MIPGMGSSLNVTPISADVQAGGTRNVQKQEDNMVGLDIATEETENTYNTDSVIQNTIQETPIWLIVCFALCLPTPWGAWRTRKLNKQLSILQEKYIRLATLAEERDAVHKTTTV